MFVHVAIKAGNKHKTWLKKHLKGAQIENVWMLKMQIVFCVIAMKGMDIKKINFFVNYIKN